MTSEQIYQAAYGEATKVPGYSISTDAMRAASERPLSDGDRIGLGGELVAEIHGDRVRMIHKGKQTAELAIADLTQEQVDRMRIKRTVQAGRRGVSVG